MSGETILVVDDSKATLDFAVDYVLKPNGYKPLIAHDGAEGVRKAFNESPDLIVLDFEMPRMNGLEVLRTLNDRSLNIPVILSTAHGSEAIAVEVFRLGVRDYVTKPYEVPDMLLAIENALTETRIRRERDDLMKRLVVSNRSLESRLRELNTLFGIGKSVTALINQDDLLKRIVEAAQYVTGAQACALLLGAADGKLFQRAAIGSIEKLPADRAQLIEQITHTHKPTFLATEVVAPLLVSTTFIGLLDAWNTAANLRPFTDHDAHLLQALADYAAIAIENSRLFRDLEETKEREKKAIRSVFERYVAPPIVDQIFSKPELAGLGGARRSISVLFADVRGFTALTDQIQPETLVQTLNDHLSIGAQVILKHAGTLDKFMGDGLMAMFNAPLPQSNYQLQAVTAALEMQQLITERAAKMKAAIPMRFGIGITSGEAIVGNIGAAEIMNFTAVGTCVNIAKRLQEAAKGGQVLIDSATYQSVSPRVRTKSFGPIEIKGFTAPLEVFEVLGLR
jgi:class 3 adenylate cyclase/DNA-binding response OmpR family regulator